MTTLALLLACAHAPVQIAVVGAQLDPLRADSTPWDGPTAPPSALAATFAGPLLTVDPAVPAALALADITAAAFASPDVMGRATLYADGAAASAVSLTPVPDTLVPAWCRTLGPSCPTLGPVALTDDVRLVLALVDDDLASDDSIDPVTLDARALRRALRSGELAVATDAQARGEVTFVYVSVTRAPK
jgi:hypothetical protein